MKVVIGSVDACLASATVCLGSIPQNNYTLTILRKELIAIK
jgi:hypothetical protein